TTLAATRRASRSLGTSADHAPLICITGHLPPPGGRGLPGGHARRRWRGSTRRVRGQRWAGPTTRSARGRHHRRAGDVDRVITHGALLRSEAPDHGVHPPPGPSSTVDSPRTVRRVSANTRHEPTSANA